MRRELIKDIIAVLAPAVVVAFLLNFVFLVTTVESGSMEPTLMTGSIVVFDRLAYKNRAVQRGDVIVFKEEDTKKLIGKRVIGIPGDEISFRDGYVVLNNEIINESNYIKEDIETNSSKTFNVPEGYIFVLGDNRENSYDSRFWENPYVNKKNIKGRLLWNNMKKRETSNNQDEYVKTLFECALDSSNIYTVDINGDCGDIAIAGENEKENRDPTKAYSSTIYEMLKVGDNGILSVFNYELTEIEQPIICISNVYRGNVAENIINNYFASGDSIYSYLDAPEGCHWEAAKYDLNYRDCKTEDYVDIRVIGFDGNKLNYRGADYPTRTYNIYCHVIKEGNWYKDYYVFYAIPNGCTDYALMCGDYIEGTGIYPAYYKMKNE